MKETSLILALFLDPMYLEECTCFFQKSSKTTENLVFENKYTHKYAYTHRQGQKEDCLPSSTSFPIKKDGLLSDGCWELKEKVAFFLQPCFPCSFKSVKTKETRKTPIFLLLPALLSIYYPFCTSLHAVHTSMNNPFNKFSSIHFLCSLWEPWHILFPRNSPRK